MTETITITIQVGDQEAISQSFELGGGNPDSLPADPGEGGSSDDASDQASPPEFASDIVGDPAEMDDESPPAVEDAAGDLEASDDEAPPAPTGTKKKAAKKGASSKKSGSGSGEAPPEV